MMTTVAWCRSRSRMLTAVVCSANAAGKPFAGAPTTNTDGACDLLMITLPSALTTLDLQHGDGSTGPLRGAHLNTELARVSMPLTFVHDLASDYGLFAVRSAGHGGCTRKLSATEMLAPAPGIGAGWVLTRRGQRDLSQPPTPPFRPRDAHTSRVRTATEPGSHHSLRTHRGGSLMRCKFRWLRSAGLRSAGLRSAELLGRNLQFT